MSVKRVLLGVVTLVVSATVWAATEVITLQHRMADDVLPVARSVVGDQGRVSSYGNQLIVNAPDAVVADLRQVLGQLDQAPRRLLITVTSQESGLFSESGHAVDGSIGMGDVRIRSGRGEGDNRVRIIRHSTASRDGGTQQVQATEGYPALIQIGQSVPLTSSSIDPYGQVHRSIEYRDVMQGFYATAQVNGDRVQVTLSSQRDRAGRAGVVELQSTETRVNGALGEWLEVGGVSESAARNQNDITRHHATRGQQDYRLRLKVEVLE